MDDLPINARLTIPAGELEERFSRSSGPGGQNVNKVESKVELRWNLTESQVVSEPDRQWLLSRLGARLNKDGTVSVTCDAHRDQVRNRQEARDRLTTVLREALLRPKKRKKTRPKKSAVEKRLRKKKATGQKKKDRGFRGDW